MKTKKQEKLKRTNPARRVFFGKSGETGHLLFNAIFFLLIFSVLAQSVLFVFGATDEKGAFKDGECLLVSVLDVGQGDAILISQGGEHLLVDTGSFSACTALMNELWYHGVEKIDYLLLTHAHEDHYGNIRAVLRSFPVEHLFLPQTPDPPFDYEIIPQEAKNSGVEPEYAASDQCFSVGHAVVEVLGASDSLDVNNASTVLRVTFGETVLLFMGDAEHEREEALIEQYGRRYLQCDFLKAGHHGSGNAGKELFLAASDPDTVVISCGENNRYGFPDADALSRYCATGATVFRTDLSGTLEFISDGRSVRSNGSGGGAGAWMG